MLLTWEELRQAKRRLGKQYNTQAELTSELQTANDETQQCLLEDIAQDMEKQPWHNKHKN